jgi:hypothetical protein
VCSGVGGGANVNSGIPWVPRYQSAVYAASVQPERRSSDAIMAWRRNALHALVNVSATPTAIFECGTSDKVKVWSTGR